MSLQTRLTDLATRIAAEVKTKVSTSDRRIPTIISRSAFDLLTPPVPGKVYLVMTDADYASMQQEMNP